MEQLEMSPVSILRLFETTKDQRQDFVVQLVERIEEGYVNPLEAHLQIKCMEDVIKSITSNETYKSCLIDAAGKEGKSFDFHNAKFETKEVGVKYDFSRCDDPEMESLCAQMEGLKEKIKARETFLKSVPLSGMEILFGDEVVKVFPPSKTSTTSIAVTLKK